MAKITSGFRLPLTVVLLSVATLFSCNKDVKEFVSQYFQSEADPDGIRLDRDGNASTIASGDIGITPDSISNIGIHYMELVPDAGTAYKNGIIIYRSAETFEGGEIAIDFDSLLFVAPGTAIFNANLRKIPPGTYSYIRASVACISYDMQIDLDDIPGVDEANDVPSTFYSFLGYRTYIRIIQGDSLTQEVNANRALGFWLLETKHPGSAWNKIFQSQVNSNQVTVVNELSGTAPIPNTTGVITGRFEEPLVITGEEPDDLYITLTFSVNDVLEVEDSNGDGNLDINYQFDVLSEVLKDHGLRSLRATFEYR